MKVKCAMGTEIVRSSRIVLFDERAEQLCNGT